jgi:hypothetical protein
MREKITIDLSTFYTETAKLDQLSGYEKKAQTLAGAGNDITLTGAAPVWLYLTVAHALHGKAKKLIYSSPVTSEITIFDHDPY